MSAPYILVVDDEPDIRNLVQEILEDEDYEVATAENSERARSALRNRRPELVLLDIWMPDLDGITLLKEWAEGDGLPCPVIMMSGHGTVETAGGGQAAAREHRSASAQRPHHRAGGQESGHAEVARTGQAHRPARYLGPDHGRARQRPGDLRALSARPECSARPSFRRHGSLGHRPGELGP